MSYHVFTHNLDPLESTFETFDNTFLSSTENIRLINSNHPRAPRNIYTSTISTSQSENLLSNPWQPSNKLSKLYDKFQTTILYQFPCIPCSYCSKLMYPNETRWIKYDPLLIYPLQKFFPDTSLQFHSNDLLPTRIARCASCLKSSTRRHPPKTDKIPKEIQKNSYV